MFKGKEQYAAGPSAQGAIGFEDLIFITGEIPQTDLRGSTGGYYTRGQLAPAAGVVDYKTKAVVNGAPFPVPTPGGGQTITPR